MKSAESLRAPLPQFQTIRADWLDVMRPARFISALDRQTLPARTRKNYLGSPRCLQKTGRPLSNFRGSGSYFFSSSPLAPIHA